MLPEVERMIRWGQAIAAVAALTGVFWQQSETRAQMTSQFAGVRREINALQQDVKELQGYRAQADRRATVELALACANRRMDETECNARLPAEIRDLWQLPQVIQASPRGGR